MGSDGREAIRGLPRFHVLPEQMTGGRVNIEREQARKIVSVLRLGSGDQLAVINGTGICFRCRIVWAERDNVSAEVLERYTLDTEPPYPITVVQALPKGDKLEQVVRSCTEAGATEFVMFPGERSIPRWVPEKVDAKLERLRAIAQDAAEVAIRARVPAIEWSTDMPVGPEVTMVYEGEGEPLARIDAPLTLLVGPEGGFSENEVRLAAESGCRLASLGPRILRTEHAAFFAIAQALAGG